MSDDSGELVAGGAYCNGTPELSYSDRDEVALIDQIIVRRDARQTGLFAYGLREMSEWIRQEHPSIREIRFAALAGGVYLRRLCSQFAEFSCFREGARGTEDVYRSKLTV